MSHEWSRSDPPAHYHEFATYEERLQSFSQGWHSACPMNPHDLAEAGLFYVGTGDKVQCAFCRGKLYNWGPSDVAFVEHAKHFPKCAFVLDRKRKQLGTQRSNASFGTQNSVLGLPACQTMKEEGYSDNAILKAVTKLVKEMRINIADLQVDILRDVVVSVRADLTDSPHSSLPNISETSSDTQTVIGSEPTPEVSHSSEPEPVDNTPVNSGPTGESNFQTPGDVTNQDTTLFENRKQMLIQKILQLKEEEEHLRRLQFCKACKSRDANTLYLPCRHLVCCDTCAENAITCVHCEQSVLGSVKTYKA